MKIPWVERSINFLKLSFGMEITAISFFSSYKWLMIMSIVSANGTPVNSEITPKLIILCLMLGLNSFNFS